MTKAVSENCTDFNLCKTFFKKFTAACYYRLLTSMSAYPIPLDTGDFRLIGRNVADVFLKMREHGRFLRGMSAWMVPWMGMIFDLEREGYRYCSSARSVTMLPGWAASLAVAFKAILDLCT